MSFKALSLFLLAVASSGQAQEDDSACRELQPVDGFKNDFLVGKFYWILQKIAYDNQRNFECYMTYSFVDGNVWTFLDMHQSSYDGLVDCYRQYDASTCRRRHNQEQFVKEVGVMDTPGHWNVSTAHPDGTPFTYSLTAIAGKSKKYVLLYSCNPDNGEFALWFIFYKRVSPRQIDQETYRGVIQALATNNLNTIGAYLVDNTQCDCK